MSRRFLIINSIFLGIATFVQWGLSGFLGVIGEAIDLIMCAGVATFLILLIRWNARDFRRVYIRSFFFLSGFLGICSTILLIFIIIQNTFPGAVGKIILTNSEKTIVFYQMSHIATPAFYTEVQHDLQVLTDSGYTIYAE